MNEHSRQPGRIGVFLVDDHEIFRRGIRALLAGEADIEVIGEADTALAAMARMPALRRTWRCSRCGCRTGTASRSAGRSARRCRRPRA